MTLKRKRCLGKYGGPFNVNDDDDDDDDNDEDDDDDNDDADNDEDDDDDESLRKPMGAYGSLWKPT